MDGRYTRKDTSFADENSHSPGKITSFESVSIFTRTVQRRYNWRSSNTLDSFAASCDLTQPHVSASSRLQGFLDLGYCITLKLWRAFERLPKSVPAQRITILNIPVFTIYKRGVVMLCKILYYIWDQLQIVQIPITPQQALHSSRTDGSEMNLKEEGDNGRVPSYLIHILEIECKEANAHTVHY